MKLLILIIFTSTTAWCQIVTYTTDKSGALSATDANVTAIGLSRVNGAKKPGSVCKTGFSSKSFPKSVTYSDLGAAVEFSFTPRSGYYATVTQVSVESRRSKEGTMFIRIAYSTDGVTWTDNGLDLSPKQGSCGDVVLSTWDMPDFSSQGEVKLRIYGYNASSSNGVLTVQNIVVNGTVLAPEMTITDIGTPVNRFLWGGTVADLAYTGSLQDCKAEGRITTGEPIYGLIKGFNWHFISYSEGQASQVDWCRINDTLVTRVCVKGEKTGYNCNSPLAIKGACNCTYKVDGKCLDFFNDAVALKTKLGAKGVVTINVESGTPTEQLDQLAWKIKRFNPSFIILGQEENAKDGHFKGDASKYLDACKPLIDFTRATYPNITIVGDAAPIQSTAKNNVVWNKTLFSSHLFDAFDIYAQLDELTEFNGDISHDTTELNKVRTILKERVDSQVVLSGVPVFVSQINASETFSDAGSVVYEGQFMPAPYIFSVYEELLSNPNVIGGIWQTIKNVTGKNTLDVNGQVLYAIGSLFTEEATSISISQKSGVTIYGVKSESTYKLILVNKTGRNITLPKTLSLDGKIILPAWNEGKWLFTDSYTSKQLTTYDCTGSMKFGFGYATIKTN